MKDNDTFSDEIWKAYFDIPIIHYSDRIMANLPRAKKNKWNKFLDAKVKLEALGIKVNIVPLSLDKRQKIWWVDYPHSYVERFKLNPDQSPELTLVIKVGDDGRYIEKYDIAIDHFGIQRKLKRQVLDILSEHEWFVWNKKQQTRMFIRL